MDSNTHLYIGQSRLAVHSIHRGHGQLHSHGAGYRPLGVVLPPYGSAEDDENGIANELINRALVLHDDLDHGAQVAI